MSRLASLAPKRRLTCRLEQIPDLRQNRKQESQGAGSHHRADAARKGNDDGTGNSSGKSPDRSRPCLLGAHLRPQQRTADGPAA
jgi:hypothetical protein